MKSATDFLPMSSASIRSLAKPRLLVGTPKDKKYTSKLELKGLVKPETASSTHKKPIITLYCLPDSHVKSISQAKNQWL